MGSIGQHFIKWDKSKKPLIATTNLTPDEMAKEKDTSKYRVYDRILEMCCTTVILNGESRRLKIRKEKREA